MADTVKRLFAIGIALAMTLLVAAATGCQPAAKSTSSGILLNDRAEIFSSDERAMLANQLDLLLRETGVELNVETVELEPGADLERYTTEQFDRDATDGNGSRRAHAGAARMVFDATQGTLRLAVGYSLEQLLPDAYVGFWIREHSRYLFDANQPAKALLFAVRMLRDRIRSEALVGNFRVDEDESPRRFEHGGAGASEDAPLARGELDPFADRSPSILTVAHSSLGMGPRLLSYANPGETVEATYRNYLAWLAAGRFETQLTLFTPSTREFLRDWPMTPGYFEHILTKEIGRSFEAIVRADRALLYCLDDPFVAPHFFELSEAGWRIDLAAEAREVININGGPYSWSLRSTDWLRPFADEIVRYGEVRRLSRSDNRPATLPRMVSGSGL